MAFIAIDKDETFEYTSTQDNDEIKTIFHLGVLSCKDKVKIFQGMSEDYEKFMQNKSVEIFVMGVKKVSNLKTKSGSEITDSAAAAEALPISVVIEVAAKIIEINFVSESESKN